MKKQKKKKLPSKKGIRKISKTTPIKGSVAGRKDLYGSLSVDKKNVLHVVFGDREQHARLHNRFKGDGWNEVILEIGLDSQPFPSPDIGIFDSLGMEIFDALWVSHTLEFFYAHQIGDLMQHFHRVLKYGGVILISTPDMQQAAEQAYREGMDTVMYKVGAHDIMPIDMIYGFRPGVEKEPENNMHRIGFSAVMLGQQMKRVNFADIKVQRDGYKLWGAAIKLRNVNPEKNTANITAPDVNKKMAIRDNIDQPPTVWKGFPPK